MKLCLPEIMLQNDSSVDHTGRAMAPFLSILEFLLKFFCWTAFSKWSMEGDYKNEQALVCVNEYDCSNDTAFTAIHQHVPLFI